MNLEKFTDRAKGFLQSAQTVAIRMNHQRISPEHLLKALLEDEQGMAAGLIQAAGGDAKRAVAETDAALARVPAVTGSGAQQAPGLDNDAVRVLDQAEQIAGKAGDSFVTVERLLLALDLTRRPQALLGGFHIVSFADGVQATCERETGALLLARLGAGDLDCVRYVSQLSQGAVRLECAYFELS